YMALFGFGHIEVGTVTPKGQPGNEKPRLFRLCKDNALINRMGFNNHGVDAAVEKLKKLRRDGVVIGGNIGKNTATPNEDAVGDYLDCFIKLYDHVDYFVVNISCPNVTNLHHLQDKDSLSAILGAIVEHRAKQITFKPILLKISPDLNFNQIDDTLEVLKQYNIDGVVISNTTVTRDNLITDKSIVENIGRGGLSGKPIKERSTELIRYVAQKTNHTLPIIGVGGIMSAADAQEKIDAGASLVQIYTGFIYEGPFLVKRINKQLQ
ncbi:MAG TPA: quinone-dependent dihydroorotate dehydrogenase, partial [Bacteroidales bacterium]